LNDKVKKHSYCCYRLEQLARLGLPAQLFIPALLQELHHDLSSFSNSFLWQDEQENFSNIYDEMQNMSVIQSFILAISREKPDSNSHTMSWVSQLNRPTTSYKQHGKNSRLTALYKRTLLPLKYFNTCFIPVFESSSNKRLGLLMVHREESQPEFTCQERDLLEHIASIIAHGLQQPEIEKMLLTDGWEQGILIVNQKGQVQKASPMGEKLLSLASFSSFNASTKPLKHDISGFKDSKNFIKNLFPTNDIPLDNVDTDLVISTHNAWGNFILKGFLIKDIAGNRGNTISLHIRKQEPFVLKLFHRIKMLNLTPRQETVGLFYAAGIPNKTISEKLDLSLYTVKEHTKNIYERLNIKSRADLIELIICDSTSNLE